MIFPLQGTSADQDSRFSDKEKKLMKNMRFEGVLSKKARWPNCDSVVLYLNIERHELSWKCFADINFLLLFIQPLLVLSDDRCPCKSKQFFWWTNYVEFFIVFVTLSVLGTIDIKQGQEEL